MSKERITVSLKSDGQEQDGLDGEMICQNVRRAELKTKKETRSASNAEPD
jgi:hypothetical protein